MDQNLVQLTRSESNGVVAYLYRFLRTKQKNEMLPELIEIQGGFICFYCKGDLTGTHWIYEHLDDDRQHNVIENIRLAHQACNIKKVKYIDYQLMAKEELDRQSELCLSERKNEVHDKERSEIEINTLCRNYTKKFISEHIDTDGSILYTVSLWSIVNDLNEKYNCGSEAAIRRHLNALTSETGKFKIIKNDSGKREIVRRTEN